MYQYVSKGNKQSEKSKTNISTSNQKRMQIKIPVQTKSLFSQSLNDEKDASNPVQLTPTALSSPLQMQLQTKQKYREPHPLLIKSIKEQKPLEPTSILPNNTGIPLQMKERFENLSGFSFDDVRVHYNSYKPAQLRALAYTQGNQVYIAPNQEKYLGHELGHVVQQKQGIVKPTAQLNHANINDDVELERTADKIATQIEAPKNLNGNKHALPLNSILVIQRKITIGGKIKKEGDLTSMVYKALNPTHEIFNGKCIKEIIQKMIKDKKYYYFDDDKCLVEHVKGILSAEEEEESLSIEKLPISGPNPEVLPQRFSSPVVVTNGFIFMSYAGNPVILYRSMEEKEYNELLVTITEMGLPIFKYKDGKKKDGNAEKFFAPNIHYLATGMSNKGARKFTVRINLHPNVIQDLLYNPQFAGFDINTMDQSLLKRGLKRVNSKNQIIIKNESHNSSITRSQNIGFRLSGRKLEDFARYIISLYTLDKDLNNEINIDPVTSLNEIKPCLIPIDEEEEEFMQVIGDLFSIDNRTYDVTSNKVPAGHCLWALLLKAGISQNILQQAAMQINIEYNDFVEVDTIPALIQKINELSADNQFTIHLDIFLYEGIYLRSESFIAGNGGTQIMIGLVCDSEGNGHYINAQ